jgi:hypothetical protein
MSDTRFGCVWYQRGFGWGKLIGTLVMLAVFLFYPVTLVWETHTLDSFCKAVRPGTRVADLRSLAEKHHVDATWLKDGKTTAYKISEAPPKAGKRKWIFGEEGLAEATDAPQIRKEGWRISVVSMMTFGDMACEIYTNEDKTAVVFAGITQYDQQNHVWFIEQD